MNNINRLVRSSSQKYSYLKNLSHVTILCKNKQHIDMLKQFYTNLHSSGTHKSSR